MEMEVILINAVVMITDFVQYTIIVISNHNCLNSSAQRRI